jgi:hypothetical protein
MKKNGKPAFPRGGIGYNEGMTLRDYFAGQALAGIVADNATIKLVAQTAYDEGLKVVEVVSMSCYEYADAMLKERDK